MKKETIPKPGTAEELYRKYQELYPEQFLNDQSSVKLINSPSSLILDPRFFPKTRPRGSYSRSVGGHQRRQESYPHNKKTGLP